MLYVYLAAKASGRRRTWHRVSEVACTQTAHAGRFVWSACGHVHAPVWAGGGPRLQTPDPRPQTPDPRPLNPDLGRAACLPACLSCVPVRLPACLPACLPGSCLCVSAPIAPSCCTAALLTQLAAANSAALSYTPAAQQHRCLTWIVLSATIILSLHVWPPEYCIPNRTQHKASTSFPASSLRAAVWTDLTTDHSTPLLTTSVHSCAIFYCQRQTLHEGEHNQQSQCTLRSNCAQHIYTQPSHFSWLAALSSSKCERSWLHCSWRRWQGECSRWLLTTPRRRSGTLLLCSTPRPHQELADTGAEAHSRRGIV